MYPSWKIMMMHTIFQGYVLRWETLVGSEEGNVRPNGRGSNWSVTALNLQTLVQGIYQIITLAGQQVKVAYLLKQRMIFPAKKWALTTVNDLEYTWKRDLANPLIAHYVWMSRKALNSGCSGIGFGSAHKASQGVTRWCNWQPTGYNYRVNQRVNQATGNIWGRHLAAFVVRRSAWPRPGQKKGKCQVNCRIWLLKFDRKSSNYIVVYQI